MLENQDGAVESGGFYVWQAASGQTEVEAKGAAISAIQESEAYSSDVLNDTQDPPIFTVEEAEAIPDDADCEEYSSGIVFYIDPDLNKTQ